VFLGDASLRGRRCRLSNKVATEVLVFIKDCCALVWGVVFIITLLAGFVLVFRWHSSRYWKISIWVDSLWKIGTKLQGSPAWSLSCGIRLLGWSPRVSSVDCLICELFFLELFSDQIICGLFLHRSVQIGLFVVRSPGGRFYPRCTWLLIIVESKQSTISSRSNLSPIATLDRGSSFFLSRSISSACQSPQRYTPCLARSDQAVKKRRHDPPTQDRLTAEVVWPWAIAPHLALFPTGR
jgi:hypothetical protein